MTTKLQAEPQASSLGARIADLVRAWLVAPVVRWHRRNALYREMVDMDDRILADIGLSRYDIPHFVRNAPVDDEIAETGSSNENEPADRDEDHPESRLAA